MKIFITIISVVGFFFIANPLLARVWSATPNIPGIDLSLSAAIFVACSFVALAVWSKVK